MSRIRGRAPRHDSGDREPLRGMSRATLDRKPGRLSGSQAGMIRTRNDPYADAPEQAPRTHLHHLCLSGGILREGRQGRGPGQSVTPLPTGGMLLCPAANRVVPLSLHDELSHPLPFEGGRVRLAPAIWRLGGTSGGRAGSTGSHARRST